MAKRYIRINWQNKPSTATPVSAANLNKMDKGIDDLDNAIEEIYAKRVNNTTTTNSDTFLAGPVGKNLQDQITTLNNNLAGLKENYKLTYRRATTQAELDVILNGTSGYLTNSIYEYVVDVATSGLTLSVGWWVIRGYKYNDDTTGWQEAKTYNTDITKRRRKTANTWTTWVDK